MSEEKKPCLDLDFRCLGYAFFVADSADKLLDAFLNREPAADIVRGLSQELYELDVESPDTYAQTAIHLIENEWIRAEIEDGRLKLWCRGCTESDPDEEKSDDGL